MCWIMWQWTAALFLSETICTFMEKGLLTHASCWHLPLPCVNKRDIGHGCLHEDNKQKMLLFWIGPTFIYRIRKTEIRERGEASGECCWVSIMVTVSVLYLSWFAFNIFLWNATLLWRAAFITGVPLYLQGCNRLWAVNFQGIML